MTKRTWLQKNLLTLLPAVAAAALSTPRIAQAQASAAYGFGSAANGLRLCYAVDATGAVMAGSDPVADDLCPLSYQLGVADDGTQRCFAAEASGAILVGRGPVDSTFCPPPMTTSEAPPPQPGQMPPPPGVPGQPAPQNQTGTPPLLVRISSVNDVIDPNHPREIIVHPGDMIRLAADHFEPSRGFVAMRSYAEDFIWSANDFAGDVCDVANRNNCFGKSNFQATNYGVIFYVPYTIQQSLTITVASHNPRATDAAGNPVVDTIILKNAQFSSSWLAPKAVITTAEEYRYDRLDANLALAGHGHWVWIEGVRYFSPTTYVFTDKRAWEPYRHGYWAFDNTHGWTWISYDPWGWFTDHYGVWRHHGMYGWVWLPFPDLRYVPHAVTWFSANGYVGWFPYYEHFPSAYHHGRRQAFIDGFEFGVRAAQYAADSRFQGGFTMVPRAQFNHTNIYNITIVNRTTIYNVTSRAMAMNALGRSPGGGLDRVRKFVAESRGTIPMTQAIAMSRGGGGRLYAPSMPRSMPRIYTSLAKSSHNHLQTPVPFGTTRIASPQRPDQVIKTIAPSQNGKAFAVPAHGITPMGKRFFAPPLTGNPAQPNKQNPIYSRQAVANPPAPGQATSKPLPAYQPEKAPPPPAMSRPLPNPAPFGPTAQPPTPRVPMQNDPALMNPQAPPAGGRKRNRNADFQSNTPSAQPATQNIAPPMAPPAAPQMNSQPRPQRLRELVPDLAPSAPLDMARPQTPLPGGAMMPGFNRRGN